MQVMLQTAPDRARRRSKVPDVRALDRGCDKKHGARCIAIAVVAETPMWCGGNYSMITLARAQPKRLNCVALGTAHDVGNAELSATEGVHRGLNRGILA